MTQAMQPTRRSLAFASALLLAGCGISGPGDVSGLTRAVGDTLPGARGETLADQDRIDVTVARGCAAGVWSRADCDRHTKVSAARRRELVQQPRPAAGV